MSTRRDRHERSADSRLDTLQRSSVRRYIFSTDHKVVGLQYFFLSLTAVLIGVVLSLLMRFHLVWPMAHLPFVRGGIMTPEQYLALVTLHGTIMVFFVLTTAPQNASETISYPFKLARRRWLSRGSTPLLLADVRRIPVLLATFVVPGGAPISGWTAYPPLSGLGEVPGPGKESGKRCGSLAS